MRDTGGVTRFGMTYIAGSTPVHRCDARLKIGLLFAYSLAIFALSGWWGLGALVVVLAVVFAVSKLPLGLMSHSLVPVYWLAAFSLLFNVIQEPGIGGLLTGLYFAVRMVALVAASFVVCFTTTSSELLQAFSWIIGPLRRFHVPVDDISFTLALSLRFIPVIEQEFERIRMAQKARGAGGREPLSRKLEVWGMAFAALFVGLFRHADNLANAMDARCYGATPRRTRLPK